MDDLTSSDNSGIGSPCSVHYLRCIKFNLLAIAMSIPTDFLMGMENQLLGPSRRAGYDMEDNHKDFMDNEMDKFLDICLGLTSPELDRLQEHPELFPSKTMEENFYYDVSIICDLLLNLTTTTDDAFGFMSELDRLSESRFKEVLFPAQDERRKPWQQFLHNNAPGSGIHASRMTHCLAIDGMKITQALPMSVAKFLEGIKLERDKIRKELGLVSFEPSDAYISRGSFTN